VGTDDGAIEDQVLQVGVMSKVLVHPFPDAFLAPAGEPFVHRVPIAIGFWQQPPLGAAAGHPENSFNKATALCRSAYVDLRAGT
jgi:hypothetical protein